jgi:hypothetical protein
MKYVLVGPIVLFAGCFPWRPGNDSQGSGLRQKAKPVLEALVQFEKEHGHFPTAPSQLMPKYLLGWPTEPKVQFDDYTGHIRFTYSPSWPQSGQVECVAKFGQLEFSCHGYM